MARSGSAAPTRASVVLQRLRSDVLNGRLAPGSKLGFAELGARYNVSSGVLREVLPRLVEQGLATSEAQLGFRVIDVSVDNLTQLTDARVAIETLRSAKRSRTATSPGSRRSSPSTTRSSGSAAPSPGPR